MAAMDKHSFEQLRKDEPISILDSCGSKGKSAILSPISVMAPSSSSAPR